MEDQLRDLIIKIGGPWPVVGGSVLVFACLAWAAFKVKDESEGMAYALGGAAAGVAVAVFMGLGAVSVFVLRHVVGVLP